MKLVSESLGVSRSQLTARIKQANEGKGARHRRIPDDTALVERIKASISDLPSYGYRRVWALLRRQAEPAVNVKRVYRVMRDHDLWPTPWTLEQFGALFSNQPFGRWYLNTLLVSAASTAVASMRSASS